MNTIHYNSDLVWYIFRNLTIIMNSDRFTSYLNIFNHIVVYSEFCVTLAYREPCHIQNSGILRIQDVFKTLSTDILAYAERCVTFTYWELGLIQDFSIFRSLAYLGLEAYSESCLFRHMQAYIMIVTITLTFFFFTLIWHTFQQNLKMHMLHGYNDVNFNARLSLLKKYVIFENDVIIE